MDRRKEPRLAADAPATLTLLSDHGTVVEGVIENWSGEGVALRTARQIPLSAPVRVDVGDDVLLGEVCHCSQNQGHYLVGIMIEHVIGEIHALLRLNQVLLDEQGEDCAKPYTGPSVRIP